MVFGACIIHVYLCKGIFVYVVMMLKQLAQLLNCTKIAVIIIVFGTMGLSIETCTLFKLAMGRM